MCLRLMNHMNTYPIVVQTQGPLQEARRGEEGEEGCRREEEGGEGGMEAGGGEEEGERRGEGFKPNNSISYITYVIVFFQVLNLIT